MKVNNVTRVTIEITALGYTTTVWAGEEKLVERSMRMQSKGSAKGTSKGDFYDDFGREDEFDGEDVDTGLGAELADALEDHDPFDIAGVLYELAEYRGEELPDEETG